jgi:hypothetical protein
VETSVRRLSASSRHPEAIPLLPSAPTGYDRDRYLHVIHGGVRTDNLRTGTGLLTHTPLIDIRQHGPSNAACRIDLRRAQQAENMPRGTSAPRAEHLWMEHRAGASTRARFTRAPPTRGRITRAAPAVHVDVRHVLGLEDAPAHCPATGGAQGQHRAGAIGVRQKCVRCVRQHTCSRCMPT